MNDTSETKKTRPCPAYRDNVFVAVNILIWLLGAFGMYWITSTFPLNLLMSATYLAANIIFFWLIFSRAVCPNCAYQYPELSQEEYFARFKDRFVKALSFWYKVWFLIGWVWPILTMALVYAVSRRPVLLASLIVFLLVAVGVFFPILRLRVCANCKANELGICPFFSPKPAQVP